MGRVRIDITCAFGHGSKYLCGCTVWRRLRKEMLVFHQNRSNFIYKHIRVWYRDFFVEVPEVGSEMVNYEIFSMELLPTFHTKLLSESKVLTNCNKAQRTKPT